MNPKMTAEIMTITPEIAQQWLNQTTVSNRDVKPSILSRLVRDIESGRFECNGESIVLNGDGSILDGQHRLQACAATGRSITSVVVRGVPTETMPSFDSGPGRSHSDAIKIAGIATNSSAGAAIKLVYRYDNDLFPRAPGISNREMVEMASGAYAPVVRSLEFVLENDLTRQWVITSVTVACHAIFKKIDPQMADAFIRELITGEGSHIDSPTYRLRERLLRAKMGQAKRDKVTLVQSFAFMIKAWNAVRKGTEYTAAHMRLRHTDAFPQAV